MGYNPSDLHGISRVNPLIIGVITHLLSGMNHQIWMSMDVYGGYIMIIHDISIVFYSIHGLYTPNWEVGGSDGKPSW